MKKRLFSNRGITMIEMMIGLVILGITASLAIPQFQKAVDRMNFRSANRDIVSALRTARSRAISEKKEFGVFFDKETATYTLFEETGTDPTAYESSDTPISVDTFTLTSASSTDCLLTDALSNPAIIFSSNGSASAGGMLITGSDTGDIVAWSRIEILAATGRIATETYIW